MKYESFSLSICVGFGMPTGDNYSFGRMFPSHLGFAYVLPVATNPVSRLVVIFAFRTSFGNFSILLCINFNVVFVSFKWFETRNENDLGGPVGKRSISTVDVPDIV